MALSLSVSLDSGITAAEAYARISSIQHTHAETSVSVQIWATAAARQSNLQTIKELSFSLPWTDGVSLSGAYTALKNEDFFTGAIDV